MPFKGTVPATKLHDTTEEEARVKQFGELIRDERHFLKMNQNELGKKIGVTGAYITQIEKGQKIPSLPLIVGLAKALRIDEKHLLKVALKEKAPEVAEQFFEEKLPAGARKGGVPKGVQGPENEMFGEIATNEELKLEMRKYYEFLRRRLGVRAKAGAYPNKAFREFMEDPKMPKPTEEELRLLMSVNLEYKEPTKWFYKSLLDSYRNDALFSRVRKAKAEALP